MGDPAVMTARDRVDAKQAATAVVDSVIDNVGSPSSILIAEAERLDIPVDTLILWLAQLAVEIPR